MLAGKVKMNGKEIKISKPLDAMKNGIAYLPEDRKADGIVGSFVRKREYHTGSSGIEGILQTIFKSRG